jgi:hypothetical protein
MIQMFGGFFVSPVQQQLSEELVFVINPKSVDLVCRNLTMEATNQHCKYLNFAQRKHVIFLKK